MLDELLRRVVSHTPDTLETDRSFPEAAVLVPVTRSDEPELILTLRASGFRPMAAKSPSPAGGAIPKTRT